MAKLETLFGVARGSIGKVTLRKRTTATGTRAMTASQKVTSETMTNPRTQDQVNQRARFATAVKFYKRAVAHFFTFAYEDKRANESYYNAFMRHNVNAALPMVRYQNAAPQFLALGTPYMLTQGQLAAPAVVATGVGAFSASVKGATEADAPTIGDVSAALINAGYAQANDIITIVVIGSSLPVSAYNAYTLEAVQDAISANPGVPSWNILQFRVNADDTTLISAANYVGSQRPVVAMGADVITMSISDSVVSGAAFIITRQNDNKLLASTSYLIPDTAMASLLENIKSSTYKAAVLTSWRATDSTAILEGSIAGGSNVVEEETTTGNPTINTVNGLSIPAAIGVQSVGTHKLPVVGTAFKSVDNPLKQSMFSITGDGASRVSITGLDVKSNKNALLIITVGEGATASTFSITANISGTAEVIANGSTPEDDA